MSRAPLPNSGVTSVGEMCTTSWEGITPPSSLVLAHSPLPLSSLLLRFLASSGESLQVVTSPCCPRQLPDVISNSLFLDAGSPTPAVHRVLSPVSSTMSSAFPRGKVGRLPAAIPLETTSCGGGLSRLQIFRYVPASKFAYPPDRPYRCEYSCRAAGAFTSEQNAVRCLPAHRIC